MAAPRENRTLAGVARKLFPSRTIREERMAAFREDFWRNKTGGRNWNPFLLQLRCRGGADACTCIRAGDLKVTSCSLLCHNFWKMPAGRKGKAKPTAAALPVDIEEEDEKEFSCGEEADSPRGSLGLISTMVHILSCTASQKLQFSSCTV